MSDGHNNSAASAEHFGWFNINGQHWERRAKARADLKLNLSKIRELDARHGGSYLSSKLFLTGQMEYEDCILSTYHPRQYLINNTVRNVADLWKAYFPNDTFEEFMERDQKNWLRRTVNDSQSPTGKSKKRYRP